MIKKGTIYTVIPITLAIADITLYQDEPLIVLNDNEREITFQIVNQKTELTIEKNEQKIIVLQNEALHIIAGGF